MKSFGSWECFVVGKPEWAMAVNASSSGKAKHKYWLHVTDAWPDVPFTAVRCRRSGPPRSSEQFTRCAEYRGMPNLRCGHAVNVAGCDGVVVGHNDAACFQVEFVSGKYSGKTLSVHPADIHK